MQSLNIDNLYLIFRKCSSKSINNILNSSKLYNSLLYNAPNSFWINIYELKFRKKIPNSIIHQDNTNFLFKYKQLFKNQIESQKYCLNAMFNSYGEHNYW
jgi:hypothetical protein